MKITCVSEWLCGTRGSRGSRAQGDPSEAGRAAKILDDLVESQRHCVPRRAPPSDLHVRHPSPCGSPCIQARDQIKYKRLLCAPCRSMRSPSEKLAAKDVEIFWCGFPRAELGTEITINVFNAPHAVSMQFDRIRQRAYITPNAPSEALGVGVLASIVAGLLAFWCFRLCLAVLSAKRVQKRRTIQVWLNF